MSQASKAERPGDLSPIDTRGSMEPLAKRFPFISPAPLRRSSPEIQEIINSEHNPYFSLPILAATYPHGMRLEARTLLPKIRTEDNLFSVLHNHPQRHLLSPNDPEREKRGLKRGLNLDDPTIAITNLQTTDWGETLAVGFDYSVSDYRVSRILNGLHAENPPLIAQVTGTNIVWETTEPDGSSFLVMQKRHRNNGNYGGTLGVGAAGGWAVDPQAYTGKKERVKEFEFDRHETFPMADPSNDVKRNLLDETVEELGVPRDILQQATIELLGVSKDPLVKKYDIVAGGKLPISAAQIKEYQQKAREEREFNGQDTHFIDPVTFIRATPETIEVLLRSVGPLSPASIASYMAKGTRMIYLLNGGLANHEEAKKLAEEWMGHIKAETFHNYQRIDQKVKDFFANDQDSATFRYRPEKLPEEQGLWTMEEALKRSGLEVPDYIINQSLRRNKSLN